MSSTATLPKVTVHATEGAALIRKALKKAFPGTKFSVRKSPGGSINVDYTDGPIHEDVKAVAMQFGSKGFDGQTDCPYQNYREVEIDGALVNHSIYAMVFINRDYSDQAIARAEKLISAGWMPKVSIIEKFGCRYHAENMYDPRNLAHTLKIATDYTQAVGHNLHNA